MSLPGGIDVDIATGRPLEAVPRKEDGTDRKRLQQAIQRRNEILAELAGDSPVLQTIYNRLVNRLMVLVSQDPECQALEGILIDLKRQIDYVPRMVKKQMGHVLGDIPFSEQAAPEGIPAE